MHIFVTGGTGFIGQALCGELYRRGEQVTVLSRRPETVTQRLGLPVEAVASPDYLRDHPVDVVINLAGVPIADRRWSEPRKQLLHDSRVALTQQLVDAIAAAPNPPRVLVSASAVGYYGDGGNQPLDEQGRVHPEYTHELCAAWESAALQAEELGLRVCILRIGLVIGPGGGFLARMLLPFRLGLGGRLGSGQQWMSWVHREDLLRMILYLLAHKTLRGVFNGTAPEPVRNSEFTLSLARQLGRPAVLPVPAPVLRLGMGEMSRLLLTGQRVLPRRLLDAGFEFHYPALDAALADVLQADQPHGR